MAEKFGEFEFKAVGMGDIHAMAGLLLQRQTFEGEVFPFLKNSCLIAPWKIVCSQEI